MPFKLSHAFAPLAFVGCLFLPKPVASQVLGASDAGHACMAAIRPAVDSARANLRLLAPTRPLALDKLRSRTIWYVTVTFNQFSSDWVEGLQEAATRAGVGLVTFDGQGSAARFNEGISQAVAQAADGIIVAAIDPALVSGPLQEAQRAGIPVLNGFNGDPATPLPPGMYGSLTSDFTADGALAAEWALLDARCEANVVMVTSSSVVVWQNMAAGARKAFDELCPSCKLRILDIDIANIATNLGSQLQAALQSDPSVTHVFAAGDSLVPFVTPILATAGIRAKVIGRDGLAANLEMIASRSDQDMTLAMPDFRWLGWLAFDDIARAMLKEARPDYVVPVRIVDGSNVGDGSQARLFADYVGFRGAFERAWGGR